MPIAIPHFTPTLGISFFDDETFFQLSEEEQMDVIQATPMCMTMAVVRSTLDTTGNQSKIWMLEQFSFYINTIWLPVMCLLCIGGYVVLFLSRRHGNRRFVRSTERSRFSRHLVSLCIWDLLVCMASLICNGGIYIIYGGFQTNGPYLAWITFLMEPFAQMVNSGSRWQLLMLSFERCLVVLRPLQVRVLLSRISTKHIFFFVTALAFIITVPQHLAEFSIQPCLEQETLTPSLEQTRNFFFDEHPWANIVLHLVPFIMFRLPLPFILLMMINVKYLLSSLPHMVYVVCEQLYTQTEMNEARAHRLYLVSQFALELNNALQTAHCATNWMFLVDYSTVGKKRGVDCHLIRRAQSEGPPVLVRRKWRTSLRSVSRLSSTVGTNGSRKPSMDIPTLLTINEAWKRNNCNGRFGRELLLQIGTRDIGMAHQICPYTACLDDLYFSREIATLGCKISTFLEQIISSPAWTDIQLFPELREQIRRVGVIHFQRKVQLDKSDWAIFRSLLTQFLCADDAPPIVRDAAQTMTSVIIQQICTGSTIARSSVYLTPHIYGPEGERLIRSDCAVSLV